jgi:hypothetical protein
VYKGTLLEKSIYLEDAKMGHKREGNNVRSGRGQSQGRGRDEVRRILVLVEKQHKQALSPTFHLYHYVFITPSSSHMRENGTKQSPNIRAYALIRLVKATKWAVAAWAKQRTSKVEQKEAQCITY